MDIKIKNYADNRNLKELKYIFVDALDVDPTFVRYEEEYNYCKSIPGLLEEHIELTPFCYDKNYWDETYWTSLKMDLIKNFSDRRMMHMKEVAQVFLAEKIARILKERNSAIGVSNITNVVSPKFEKKIEFIKENNTEHAISRADKEKSELEKAKSKLEEENRKTEAFRQAQARKIEQKKIEISNQTTHSGCSSKKMIGIAGAMLAVAAVVLILVLK